MRFCCAVLIAAVTVNCLVTAINGKTATKTVIEPSNMLLPPLEDKPQDAVKTTKTPVTTTTSTTTTTTKKPTTKRTTIATTTTTRKPTTTAKPVVPELSIEALLPPLFEPKIEKAEDKHKQSGEAATTTTSTTFTTATSSYTQKPIELSKPTKKPSKEVKQYTKQSLAHKHVADVAKSKPIAMQHVISNIESRITNQVVAKVAQKKAKNTISSAASTSTINYSLNGFDIYLGSTTPRPPKYGLPTITPFPRRLG